MCSMANVYNTYTEPQAAIPQLQQCFCVKDNSGHTAYSLRCPSPHPQTLTHNQQPYAALISRLMVSTPVINVL